MKIGKNIIFTLMSILGISGCTGIPVGIEPVRGFELNRYLGTWYEIARLDHRFERGLSNVTATYKLRPDGGLDVINRGYNYEKKVWKEAKGRAYFVAGPETGRLKVTFFWPFYGGYNIINLDKEDYQYALVCGPNRDYLWLLARQKKIDQELMQKLFAKAESLGFAVERLLIVRHEHDDAAP
ncbi:MAG: lipocalin [Desulfuromonas sp.]|nr:MAG: lipocalin [Desulfuromonas sp.]